MNLRYILLVFIIFSLFLDGTILSLPIFFALCLLYYILFSDTVSIFVIILLSLILDMLRVVPPGSSAIFLSLTFLVIFLIRTVAEVKDFKVIILLIFAFMYLYATIFNYSTNLFVYLLILGVVSLTFMYFSPKRKGMLF